MLNHIDSIAEKYNVQNARLDKKYDKQSTNFLHIRGKFETKDGKIFDVKDRVVNSKAAHIAEVINSAYLGFVNAWELASKFGGRTRFI